MESRLISYEIGSIAKPEWRVKALANKQLSSDDIENAKRWGKKLGIDFQPLVEMLLEGGTKGFDSDKKQHIKQWASLYVIRLLEKAGLDVVYDGEQQRSEMYQYPITHAEGFTFHGHVRSFDNKYYKKAACIAAPKITKPFHVDEFAFAKKTAINEVKIPITGAYTLADWSYDEHYSGKLLDIGTKKGKEHQTRSRRDFVLAIAKEIVRPNIQALLKEGAQWIQIDEPAVTTHPDELPLFVESFNETVRGLKGRFTIHICFSDYNLLFPHIDQLENCWGLCLGFANEDKTGLGTDKESRPGFAVLERFANELKQKFHIGVGVLDIHTDFIEPPELIRDRLLYAMDILGPEYVNPCPDCGLRTRNWQVTYDKLSNMMQVVSDLRLK